MYVNLLEVDECRHIRNTALELVKPVYALVFVIVLIHSSRLKGKRHCIKQLMFPYWWIIRINLQYNGPCRDAMFWRSDEKERQTSLPHSLHFIILYCLSVRQMQLACPTAFPMFCYLFAHCGGLNINQIIWAFHFVISSTKCLLRCTHNWCGKGCFQPVAYLLWMLHCEIQPTHMTLLICTAGAAQLQL